MSDTSKCAGGCACEQSATAVSEALERVHAAVESASKGHGRFSVWSGNRNLEVPLPVLEKLASGTASDEEKRQIRAVALQVARPCHEPFKSWAGPRAAMIATIATNDLLALTAGVQ